MTYTYYRRYQKPRRPRRQSQSGFGSFFVFIVILVLIVLMVQACVSIFNNIRQDKRDEGVLSVFKGSAEVLVWGQQEFEEASDAQIVLIGDQLRTQADSLSTLRLINGTELRLDANTHLSLDSVEHDGNDDLYEFTLYEGRVWLDHVPKDLGTMTLQIDSDLMSVESTGSQLLFVKNSEEESVYVHRGGVELAFVDRGPQDRVIDSVVLNEGSSSQLTSSMQSALLARQDVRLFEPFEVELFVEDAFYQWNIGALSIALDDREIPVEEIPAEELPVDEEEILSEDEPVLAEESTVEEPEVETEAEAVTEVTVEPLRIQIDSPTNPANIEKDAIAIEGRIVSGEAVRVTVAWSGNGQPYELGLFEAGSSSFRYVADAAYENLSAGSNTYTIRAYAEDGSVSNTIQLEVNASF